MPGGASSVAVGQHDERDQAESGGGCDDPRILGVAEGLQVRAGQSGSGGDPDVGQGPVADRRRGEAIEATAADMLQQEHGVTAGDEDDLGLPQFSLHVLVCGAFQV